MTGTAPTRDDAPAPAHNAEPPKEREPYDLRLIPPALALWSAVLAGLLVPWLPGVIGCAAVVGLAMVVSGRLGSADARRVVAVVALCVIVGFAVGAARAVSVRQGPVTELAASGAYVEIEGVVTRQPSIRTNGIADEAGGSTYAMGRIRIERITGRGATHEVRTPVLVLATEPSWAELLPGQAVRTTGQLQVADGNGDVAAVFKARDGPELVGGPSAASRATEPFRAGLRQSVAGVADPDARGLVPGLVVGDESLMRNSLREAMLITGLAHLTAVSGSNVLLILVVVLGTARWLGVRAYALPVLGVLSVLGFVLLVGPDPSVLRAATMGIVAVIGLTIAGRRRGLSTLAAAVIVLLLADPWLACSLGFVLSVFATAGILVLLPAWQDAMLWLPRPLAIAMVVPLAAQVACTPVILAASGELSLASLPANVLAAPAVAPVTVLGVAAAVVGPVIPQVAAVFGWLAGFPAWWIAAVARWFADQPGAVLAWPAGVRGVLVSIGLALAAVVALPTVLRRPWLTLITASALLVGVLKTVPTPGWPPPDWLVVACDVGQGDAFVLRVADRSAVVVDAGPEPRAVRRCLDSLEVVDVPLLVLTHFHADHVAGVPGVLAGRRVAQAIVSPLADPAAAAEDVSEWLDDAGVPMDVARVGERRVIGEKLTLDVLWPRHLIETDESDSNNASVVIAAEVDGTDILLPGDLEPGAQRALLRAHPGLTTDILKVAHHGSSRQEPGLLTELDAAIALIGVGENTYGHPSSRSLDALELAGVRIYRTDRDGSVAVVQGSGGDLEAVVGGPRVRERRRR